MVLRMDHVSIAVHDYAKADAFFTKLLGLVQGGGGKDESSEYKFQIYSAGDLSRFELIAPTGDESFLENFLKGKDGGVHHITFQTPDINAARKHLEKENIPYFGFNDKCENWKELFIHPSDAFGVLIQFSEFNPAEWISKSELVPGNKSWDIRKIGARARISIAHPGGGKVNTEYTAAELDEFIEDLLKIRRLF